METVMSVNGNGHLVNGNDPPSEWKLSPNEWNSQVVNRNTTPPPPHPPVKRNSRILLLLLLQRSTAVQVRSSVRLMPQNQRSGRGLLPSPTAWSSDQHPAAMLADVSRHVLGRTEGCGLGFGQLVRTHKGKCLKCQSSSDGHSDHNALCAGGR